MKKLSSTQFSDVYSGTLRAFGETAVKEVTMNIYRMRISTDIRTDMNDLWMYVYALSTWDNTDIDGNYITEAQMLAIVHKVQTVVL